jgi:hypothetical protein
MSVFELLSEAGRRLYQFLLKGLNEGKSGAQILRELRELGEGYRIQDFYNDLRILKGETERWDTMKHVRRDRTISEDLYTPLRFSGPGLFMTRFRVMIRDMQTGERIELYTSIFHGAPMLRGELEELVTEKINYMIEHYPSAFNWAIENITPVQGFRKVL